jgi:hypothetical protein
MERAPNPCEAGTTRKATILQLIQFQRETMVPGVGVELRGPIDSTQLTDSS